jgi:hypothetical protein
VTRPPEENEVLLRVRFPDDEPSIAPLLDTLLVEPLGDGLWRLLESPVWSDYASWHDVVEAEELDGELLVRRVVERSGCRTIRLFVPQSFPQSQPGLKLCDRLLRAGGMWEMYAEGYLMMNVPQEGDVDWEELLDQALRSFEGVGDEAEE